MKKIYKRNEVNIEHTWDLSRLYKTEEDYLNDLTTLEKLVKTFNGKYLDNIKDSKTVIKSIDDYIEINKLITYTSTYQSLHSSVDQTNDDNVKRQGEYSLLLNKLSKELTFYNSLLLDLDDEILREAFTKKEEYKIFLEDVMSDKKHKLDPIVESALTELSPVLNSHYQTYGMFKFGDMKFDSFEVSGKEYPNSFTMFENEWQFDVNHDVRRKAFDSFYKKLEEYENGLANNYKTHVIKEKAYANLKGFKSVTDYLLYDQKVNKDMYFRQVDLIMEHLSKPMRKFALTLKDIYGLDKLTYADLHLPIDPDFEKNVTIEEAKRISIEALSVYGEEYTNMVRKSFDERWIDFPQNLGKSTGGFCSSPYQKGSYILLNWNSQMNESFVLAHELGHAGHFYFASKNQNILNTRSSKYFIEAPSTINELIMADYLSKDIKDLREKRWVLSNIISRTYYHNFVTHLLEAAFQKLVYEHVDNNKPLSAKVLKEMKLKVLRDFWKDTVEIPDYAGLTWMRQPHYFMGLYPYTYSAGLTVATKVHKDIKEGLIDYKDWLKVLEAGGTKTPQELADMVNVDLSTDKPLLDTIKYISDIIDEISDITNNLKV